MPEVRSDTPANRVGMGIMIAVIIGGILLVLSWLTGFPWNYVTQ